MSTRTVTYKINPPTARPSTIPHGSNLTFDMAEVAAPAMEEVLRTAVGVVSLHALLEEFLVPAMGGASALTWRGDGIGVDVEMKRGFSGILGRFFARWCLQTHHGLTDFVPINGEGLIVSQNLVVRSMREFYLPDWICIWSNGRPVLAESRRSHQEAQWRDPTAANPLKRARD